jgi:GNAT superfamily N-acetyltransferase
MMAWDKTTREAKCRIFDKPLGNAFLQLQILATHPQYQGLGAGTALCNWGLKMARLENVPVAVFASPMGRKLYRKLGFQKVNNVIIKAEGDDEVINIAAMVYEA